MMAGNYASEDDDDLVVSCKYFSHSAIFILLLTGCHAVTL